MFVWLNKLKWNVLKKIGTVTFHCIFTHFITRKYFKTEYNGKDFSALVLQCDKINEMRWTPWRDIYSSVWCDLTAHLFLPIPCLLLAMPRILRRHTFPTLHTRAFSYLVFSAGAFLCVAKSHHIYSFHLMTSLLTARDSHCGGTAVPILIHFINFHPNKQSTYMDEMFKL